ncbi:indole-3-glycerol phosphate synthase TrpC [Thermodesulfobacteriota bacterium]
MKAEFLSKIIEHKNKEVAEAKKIRPERLLRESAIVSGKKRSFFQRLSQPGPLGANIIAEIKRASPSKGLLCPDLDPALYASNYEKGGAAALSVLTDVKYFKGSEADLQAAKNAATLPVLRKDFLISAYQLYESAAMGADAILLIVRILSGRQLKDYLDLSKELNLDALVEIHSETDLEKASLSGAKLIGINNRNLSSFETSIDTAIRMAPLLDSDQIAVAASGIRTREDINQNKEAGIWNFLIGESLVKADDPGLLIKQLLE